VTPDCSSIFHLSRYAVVSVGCSCFVYRIQLHACVSVRTFLTIFHTQFLELFMFYLLLLQVHSRKSVTCSCQSERSVESFTWLLYCFTYYKKLSQTSCLFLEDALPHIISEFCIN